jgi:flagellin
MSFGDLSRVNTNVASTAARFNLNSVNKELGETQMRLSTGLRINKAEDDSAGFSIASKLSGRITGLEQALSNVGDAKSVLDIAETGINQTMDILIEMKGLATQAANDTLGTTERDFIGSQLEALASEINVISDQTEFQGTNLLEGDGVDGSSNPDGRGTTSLTFQVGENSSDTISVSLSAISVNSLFSGIYDADESDGLAAFSVVDTDTASVSGSPDAKGELRITDGTGSADYRTFIDNLDTAINTVATAVNNVGIDQSKLSLREESLTQAITSNSAAKSRIMDADFSKEQSNAIRLQILQQTATSAFAQANSSPQAVLSFLG